ncbi:putative exocyst complex component sec8 [Golovinomyces cichoracearum]|uniref:Exocyst complex component Sec8 n=1 Tax=Golovinomyces cichoracearum TaxID=62708 RepID=A0A420IDA4_9PEZI|nr:putative exocyst complex component sec8 [Golovinomyces cichoracearum]
MSRNRPGDFDEPYSYGNDDEDDGYKSSLINEGDYNQYDTENSQRYGSPTPIPSISSKSWAVQSRLRADTGSKAGKQIVTVLEQIKKDWPAMCEKECVPVQIAIQLLDASSVGRAHEYRQFEQTHRFLQESLKAIVHENHQGFNSSIGTFHKIQSSIQSAQKRVRNLKESMSLSKANIVTTDPELKKLATASQNYSELIDVLSEIEELRLVPDQLEARISEKRFMTAVDTLQAALRRIRAPELKDIGALSDIRSYLNNQENSLTDILIEELHDHLYIKSPYCQERWQVIAESHRNFRSSKTESMDPVKPFYEILDSLDFTETIIEAPSINPEADSFFYIWLLVESLNKLGRLDFTVNSIKQRLPVELFTIVNETNSEVDQKHPSSLRGSIINSLSDKAFGSREKGIQANVIQDLLWTLYGKFESIAESHRILHEVVKSIARREGNQNASRVLGGFRELWNLYQNEIQSLLRNYVTTDVDVYQFNSSISGPAQQDLKRGRLFRFSDTDMKSAQIALEYQELEEIIRSTVPGLMSGGKQGSDGKKQFQQPGKIQGRSISRLRISNSVYENKIDEVGSHKSLVKPSVFNMSLLLSPTLEFLQRLKIIVPPGSDLATSTLTSFLDNFLVNVFLPQLDETLGKLSDSLFEEPDAFRLDPQWMILSRRPVFKGTAAFFNLITEFSRMLDNIPHDQALSQLVITQMKKYYEHCNTWFKSLVSKFRDSEGVILKLSATLATCPGDLNVTIKKLWNAIDISGELDVKLIETETSQLIQKINEKTLQLDDLLMDRETIASLCMLYTSMKWLAIKIKQLRFITRNTSDSSRTSIKKPTPRQWSPLNYISKDLAEPGFVFVPMTTETVVSEFDSIVTSYEELALTVLLTLHLEIRCQMISSLAVTLSSEKTAPYLLEQAVKEPDSNILTFNADLLYFDEILVKYFPEKEISFIRKGLCHLAESYSVLSSGIIGSMNSNGCQRMLLNIFVLQQNLKAVEPETSLNRATRFYELFNEGPDAVVRFVKLEKAKSPDGKQPYSYEEMKILIQLCYSEPILNSERGNVTAVKLNMEDHLLQLSELF